MHGRSCSSLLVVCLLTFGSGPFLWGQTLTPAFQPWPPRHSPWLGFAPGNAPSPGKFTFGQMARTAGTIFAGTVTRIEPGPATTGSAVETVAITFRVERPLRGAVPAGSLTILEWLGLWSSGQRYAVGDHVLLFLYPPSKLGLTSAVGGQMGQFHLDPAGGVLFSAAQLATFRSDPFLAGRSHVALNDFAQALHRAIGEQEPE